MKNNFKSPYYKKRRAQLEKLIEDPEKFKEKIKTEITENDVPLIHEIIRDGRINELIKTLNIDKNEFEKAKKKVIKLGSNSSKYKLSSTLFRKHKGKYKVENLIYEYHDSILKEGIEIGEEYGTKFLIEDIQNNRFSKEDIKNMSEDEINEYCDEIRDNI